jgi:hypothetical protein
MTFPNRSPYLCDCRIEMQSSKAIGCYFWPFNGRADIYFSGLAAKVYWKSIGRRQNFQKI